MNGKKPLIGISCNYDEKMISGINLRWMQDLNSTYTEAVRLSGGIPVIIPNGITQEEIPELAEQLDGFLFSGGVDVDPKRYGNDSYVDPASICPLRDETELSLLKYILFSTEKPVFGVCRGHQILNVALGGTLIIDLGSAGKEEHSLTQLQRENYSHEIVVEENSRLKEILKEETHVNSFHHQAIDKLGEGLVVTAYSRNDHVIEAVEIPGERFVLGVQWHPEELIAHASHKALFEALVEAAKA